MGKYTELIKNLPNEAFSSGLYNVDSGQMCPIGHIGEANGISVSEWCEYGFNNDENDPYNLFGTELSLTEQEVNTFYSTFDFKFDTLGAESAKEWAVKWLEEHENG